MSWEFPFADNRVCGIEITINTEGDYTIDYVVLKKSGTKVVTEETKSLLKDLNQLFALMNRKIPVIITVKGKGLIYKKLALAKGVDSFENLLNKALPNSSIDEFYVQSFSIDEANAFVSIARRSLIDPILKSFSEESFKVIGCAFGPFHLQSIFPLLLSEADNLSELIFSSHQLLIREGRISNYTPLHTEERQRRITKNEIDIDSSLLVAFGSAFSYFNKVPFLKSNISSVSSEYDEFKGEMKLKKTSVLILIISLFLLLSNLATFIYLNEQVKKKSKLALLSSMEFNTVDSLKQSIAARRSLLAKSGLSEPSRTSFYADEIAKDLPEVVTLTAMDIQPRKKTGDDERRIVFENKKILVTGKSKFSIDVNQWIRVMRAKEWINSITLLSYTQKEKDQGEFSLEIMVK
jgi:hypothetical protein